MKKNFLFTIVTVLFLSGLYSCMPIYNVPCGKPIPATKTDAAVIRQDNQTLMFVTLSGGGTRAAAMSWKVLETLKNIPYNYRDKNGSLISSNLAEQIDYISGVSGGSFAAAAWCLSDKKDMNIFRDRFIKENVQCDLVEGIFIPPWQASRLLSLYYDRIHIAAEFYDKKIFDRKTFADLPPHPVLWINATNLALGLPFTFNDKYFNLIASDLSKYPIGYACAASSAFPVLLSPMTLIKYGEPVKLENDIDYQRANKNSSDDVERDYYCKMRESFNNKENKFIHLADGGISDNQGLQPILDEFGNNGIITKKLNDMDNPLKRLIIINVNAGVSRDDNSCKSRKAPPVASVLKYTMGTSLDLLSDKRWMEVKVRCEERYKVKLDKGVRIPRSLSLLERPYTIEINFRNLKDPDKKAKCLNLPTSFYLKEDQLKLIDSVIPELVKKNPDMEKLIEVLKQEQQ